MKPFNLFKGVEYLGQAEGDRKTYYIFHTDDHYLVAGPTSGGGYYLSVVDREAPEVIARVFKGRKVTSRRVKDGSRRPDLFYSSLAALNALYTLVGQRRARKLKKREGKAILFKIK
jgi:hypothetical protein